MLFFFKKIVTIFWSEEDEKRLQGRLILKIHSIKRYDELLFKTPHNSPSCLDHVPQAIRIRGKLISQKGVHFLEKEIYFLVPNPVLKKLNLALAHGDTLELGLTADLKCIDLNKCD